MSNELVSKVQAALADLCEEFERMQKVVKIAELIQNDADEDIEEFLKSRGWYSDSGVYWTHDGHCEYGDGFSPDTAMSMEMDMALNELHQQ